MRTLRVLRVLCGKHRLALTSVRGYLKSNAVVFDSIIVGTIRAPGLDSAGDSVDAIELFYRSAGKAPRWYYISVDRTIWKVGEVVPNPEM